MKIQGNLIVTGEGLKITVQDADGNPTVSVDTIKFSNGSVTDNGDGTVTVATGGGTPGEGSFYGVIFQETDGNPPAFRNDTIYFDSASFYLHPNSIGKPVLSFRGSSGGGVTDHGALTGLTDDDHTQYLLVNGTRAASDFHVGINDHMVLAGVTLTESLGINSDIQAQIETDTGSGIAGIGSLIYLARSRGTIASRTVVTNGDVLGGIWGLGYDGTDFAHATKMEVTVDGAVTNNSVPAKIAFSVTALGTTSPTVAMTINSDKSIDMQNTLNVNNQITAEAFYLKSAGEIYPLTVKDIDGVPTATNVSTIKFTNGSVTDDGAGIVTVTTGVTLKDSIHTFQSDTINFNANHFYLSETAGSKPILNLRYDGFILPVFIETAIVQNVAIEPFAPYTYTIEQVEIDCKSGSCTAAFYVVSASGRNKNGISVGGLDPIAVSTTVQTLSATNANVVSKGDLVLMSIPANNTAKHVRVALKAKTI